MYDKLATKVNNNNDTTTFVSKTKHQTGEAELEKKLDVTNFVKKAKLTELENKIPDISSLAIKTALNFDKKTELEKKLTDPNHDKYSTTPEFNTLAADVFNAWLAQSKLITKIGFDAKLSNFNTKISKNKSKHLLVENEWKKLNTFDSSYFIGQSHFEKDGTQNYLVFQPMYRYFKRIAGVGNGSYIYYWQSKGLSDEKINSLKTPNHSITPNLNYYRTKTRAEFNGNCLKQDSVTFNHGKVVNIYIVYEISKSIDIRDYLTLENCLFGAVSLSRTAGIRRYKYSGYGIGFDRHGSLSSPGIGLCRNVISFGVDMSSSTKIDNRKKDILILGKDPTQGLELHWVQKKCILLFLQIIIKNCVILDYNGANSYLFVNGKKNHKFKAKDSEIAATPLCLGNFSKGWSIYNMKKNWIKWICLWF